MKESAPLLTSGDVGLVRIGSSRVAVFAGISALHGTAISWEDPPFSVRFYDGATFLLNAKDIAELRRLGQPTWVRSAGERHAMGNARASPRGST